MEVMSGVRQVGRLENRDLKESSGLVASRRQPGVLWTHNDGAKKPRLFAVDAQGKSLLVVPFEGVALEDWEDIAIDDSGQLYVADIGNNDSSRTEIRVHRVEEPLLGDHPLSCAPNWTWTLRFPDAPFDCESLVIHENHGYLISKVVKDREAGLYCFPLGASRDPQVLKFVATLPVTSPVTGADLSANGALLGLVSKSGAHVFRVDGSLSRKEFALLERTRFKQNQLEGCCFIPEGLLATSEEGKMFLFHSPSFLSVPK